MKSFFLILGIAVALGACRSGIDYESVKSDLMKIDREFSAASVQSGTGNAFLQYMAEEAVIYPQKGHPMRGRTEYRSLTLPAGDAAVDSRLQWEPFFVEVSQSGDLGYTLGSYILTVVDSQGNSQVKHGYYCTIWKKQPGGTWKFVFDGGNESPLPQK